MTHLKSFTNRTVNLESGELLTIVSERVYGRGVERGAVAAVW